MAKVKTAISIDGNLFKAAEERASKMGVKRSELFSRAVAKLMRDEESREITDQLNESYADGLDEEDKAALQHMQAIYRQGLKKGGQRQDKEMYSGSSPTSRLVRLRAMTIRMWSCRE